MKPNERIEHTFVVRAWLENGRAETDSWRAYVTHVASGERRYFITYDELFRFMDRWRK